MYIHHSRTEPCLTHLSFSRRFEEEKKKPKRNLIDHIITHIIIIVKKKGGRLQHSPRLSFCARATYERSITVIIIILIIKPNVIANLQRRIFKSIDGKYFVIITILQLVFITLILKIYPYIFNDVGIISLYSAVT